MNFLHMCDKILHLLNYEKNHEVFFESVMCWVSHIKYRETKGES